MRDESSKQVAGGFPMFVVKRRGATNSPSD